MSRNESILSEQSYERWLTPFDATRRLVEAGLEDREHAVGWLKNQLRSGYIDAASVQVELDENFNPVSAYIIILPTRVWRKLDTVHWKHDFWVSGDYTTINDLFDDDEERSDRAANLGHDVKGTKFDPAPILDFCQRAIGSSAPATAAPAEPSGKIRVAKRKDWWDHLWIEMIRRITTKTLRPKSPAELQVILEEYVTEVLKAKVGDSTLKPMAANLFKYLEEISGEIGENSNT